MNEKGLASFVRIAEAGSFSAAAEELYLSQSALSQQIRTLENQLGVRLFEHKGRRAGLTAAGRSFLPHAKRLLSAYYAAVAEAKSIERAGSTHQQMIRVACLDRQIFDVWLDLFHLTDVLHRQYFPIAMRFANRTELYDALVRGKADLCLSQENSEIAHYGLVFHPLAHTSELCVPFGTDEVLHQGSLTLDDLPRFRIAFHNPPGSSLYEDALYQELTQARGCTVLWPKDFFTAEVGLPTLLLAPGIDFPQSKRQYAVPLRWGQGPRVGFVHAPHLKGSTQAYIQKVTEAFAQQGCPWR